MINYICINTTFIENPNIGSIWIEFQIPFHTQMVTITYFLLINIVISTVSTMQSFLT